MSKITNIPWCDSTIDPELFPSPREVVDSINAAAANLGVSINSQRLMKTVIAERQAMINSPGARRRAASTTTNIHPFSACLVRAIKDFHGEYSGNHVLRDLHSAVACYAAKLHLTRSRRTPKKGYAPTFEQLTEFGGRMAAAARLSDLLGTPRPGSPWMDGLPRMIFVSDMGDAMSTNGLFPFLKQEIAHLSTKKGRRHLWLWMTKCPSVMRDFADEIGGFPANVCAMTSIAGPESLHRVDQLRQIKASFRGLSIEPVWGRIPPESLNLTGIDWLIVEGKSGGRPSLESAWAEELREHCQNNGTAFFLKRTGGFLLVKDMVWFNTDHDSTDWLKWPEHLRVREFPKQFHQYRQVERSRRVPRLAHA